MNPSLFKKKKRRRNCFKSPSPSRGCKMHRVRDMPPRKKTADMEEDPGWQPAKSNSPKHQHFCLFVCLSCFYLSGLQPGFGGRGLLKSSRLTPCSTALSPAPRTHGWARSRAHRTWFGEGGREGASKRRRKKRWSIQRRKKTQNRQTRWVENRATIGDTPR